MNVLGAWWFSIRLQAAPTVYVSKTLRQSLGPFKPPAQWVLAVPYLWVKRPFHELDYSLPSIGGVRNHCSAVHYIHGYATEYQISLTQSVTKHPLTFNVSRWCPLLLVFVRSSHPAFARSPVGPSAIDRPAGSVALGAVVSFSGREETTGGQIRRVIKVGATALILGAQMLLHWPQEPEPSHWHGDSTSPDGVTVRDAFGKCPSSNDAEVCGGKRGNSLALNVLTSQPCN